MTNLTIGESKVELQDRTIGDILGLKSIKNSYCRHDSELNLAIPDYQRIYCWEEKTVIKLLDDIKEYPDRKFHLGSIILNRSDGKHNIVDGQQRLVTLSLLFLELRSEVDISMLEQTFESKEAQDYIAYNKYLIRNYVASNPHAFKFDLLLDRLQFSVLIISGNSLDLAYTFFSNQNSRGKALTDYDLLKAHHLRFVHIPEQAKHVAERWDSLILQSDNDDSNRDLGRTLGVYLFRLRKWMRKRVWGNDEKYKVKEEFEAAAIIREIPPFGEQFEFYESIQGGSHFFAYAEHFIYKYKTFADTAEYKILQLLSYETHWWYRDVIESLLFAYYLKFGSLYLSDALFGITRFVSEHRYQNGRANLKSLLKHAADTEIIMIIDQATSPTFFLAELLDSVKRLTKPSDLKGIRERYAHIIDSINDKIENTSHSIFPL